MHKRVHPIPILLLIALTLVMFASPAEAADVVVIGDTQLKLVAEVVAGIRKTLKKPLSIYSPAEAKTSLRSIAGKEQPRVVIALGRDALAEAVKLPESVPVVYGFVIVPPAGNRTNMTGIYMAAPAREYAELLQRHLRPLARVAVLGGSEQMRLLASGNPSAWHAHPVNSGVELVAAVKTLSGVDALLLLPDTTVLTPAALEETFLLSFRKNIPVLGISERQVKDGALLALVADLAGMGKMIGGYAAAILDGTPVERLPAIAAGRFDLYLNVETARKMGLQLSNELIKTARKVYP